MPQAGFISIRPGAKHLSQSTLSSVLCLRFSPCSVKVRQTSVPLTCHSPLPPPHCTHSCCAWSAKMQNSEVRSGEFTSHHSGYGGGAEQCLSGLLHPSLCLAACCRHCFIVHPAAGRIAASPSAASRLVVHATTVPLYCHLCDALTSRPLTQLSVISAVRRAALLLKQTGQSLVREILPHSRSHAPGHQPLQS